MTTPESPSLALELIEQARTLSSSLADDVRTGRLDRLDTTLDQREACLRSLHAELSTLGDPKPAHVERELAALREQDLQLREWMLREKQEVLRALASLRGQRVNPYGDAISGPVALDQRS